jgi:hypothetical protein
LPAERGRVGPEFTELLELEADHSQIAAHDLLLDLRRRSRLICSLSAPAPARPGSAQVFHLLEWCASTTSAGPEQWIKEGKQAVKLTRLFCHRFCTNEVRL